MDVHMWDLAKASMQRPNSDPGMIRVRSGLPGVFAAFPSSDFAIFLVQNVGINFEPEKYAVICVDERLRASVSAIFSWSEFKTKAEKLTCGAQVCRITRTDMDHEPKPLEILCQRKNKKENP